MFDENESQEACFRTAIHCVEVSMMNRIITSEKDLVKKSNFQKKTIKIIKKNNFLAWSCFLQHKKQSTTKR